MKPPYPQSLPLDLLPWAQAFVKAAAAATRAVHGLAGTGEGRARHGTGAGGDITFEIDRIAEAAVLAPLEELARGGRPSQVLSEERGWISLGGGGGPLILIDPVDGSLNAKRGIPIYAATYALMEEEQLGAVRLAFVYDLSRGEAFWGWPGGGVWLGHDRLDSPPQGAEVEVLAFEVSRKAGQIERLARALSFAHRVRILGSQALALAYTAAGRVDGVLANTSRSIDCAAGLLLVREAGGVASDGAGLPLDDRPVGLDERVTLAVGSNPQRHAALLDWLADRPASAAAGGR